MLDRIALLLTIVGALNWGTIGLFQFDMVAFLFGGQDNIIARIIYSLVALGGVWCISLLFRDREEITKIESSAHGKSTFFFCYYGDFQSMAELRCTPRKYGLLPILRAVNDAQPDERSLVGIFANNADADRGFFEQKQGCFSQNGKIGDF